MYRSTNRAAYWNAISGDLTSGPGPGNLAFHTLTTLSVSPLDPNVIYTGSDDGNIHVTLDGGASWKHLSGDLPDRWITRVAADPVEAGVVYATISGYRWDEFLPHVFRSDDFGTTWQEISGNLPEAPVNDIIVNWPNNEILFVATDVGVFVSYNKGVEWAPLGEGMPNVVVTDLELHKPSNKLVAATYGRSMYSYDLEQDPMTSVSKYADSRMVEIFPNPFSGETNIRCNTPSKIQRLCIFNLSGNLVRAYDEPATGTLSWDGTNFKGNRMPPGQYFVRIETSGGNHVASVVLQ